jgi:endonuclease/exonuclease/phosphatase family metal-dependent hydrolase
MVSPFSARRQPDSRRPPRRPDRIYVTEGIDISDYYVVEQDYSDHHIIVAELRYEPWTPHPLRPQTA